MRLGLSRMSLWLFRVMAKSMVHNSGQARWGVLAGVLLGGVLLIGGGALFLAQSSPDAVVTWGADLSAARREAAAAQRRVFVAFSTERCGGCRKMEGVLAEPAVRRALASFVPVRVDPLEDKAAATLYGVDSFPTFVVTDAAGTVLARTVGVQEPAAFTEFLHRAANVRVAVAVPAGGDVPAVVADASAAPAQDWIARGRRMMVAADSPYASQAGLEILRAGGNAFDAAAAVSFALAVARPEGTGVGGGGFMIARFADGKTVALDFREVAPTASSPDMFLVQEGAASPPKDASRNGLFAAGVPGLVAGRCEALKRWGTLPLSRVLAPAIRLAEEGFPIDEAYAAAAKEALEEYEADPSLKQRCAFVYQTFLGGGTALPVGHVLKQPRLATFLRRLAEQGGDFFYKGEFAQALEKHMRAGGGVMTAADLAGYTVKNRTPLTGTYRDFTVIAMPPPSSGGVALLEALNILEVFPMPDLRESAVRPGPHLLIEAMKHAFADRSRYLADPDFSSVPVEQLTSKAYIRKFAMRIQKSLPDTLPVETYGSPQIEMPDSPQIESPGAPRTEKPGLPQLPEDGGTSHFCIADAAGTIVVSTETINTSFGSLAAIDEWGVVLNNQMDDFATQPGGANAFGLVQSDRNRVEPGKRPLSSMCPTIVLKDDRPLLALGASGGPRIISGVLNVMVNLLDYGVPPQEAMTAPRLHHQWQPDEVFFDRDAPAALIEMLKTRGHSVSDKHRGAIVQLILREPEGWLGASDPRKGGRPAGE